jgi:hypothetical protein
LKEDDGISVAIIDGYIVAKCGDRNNLKAEDAWKAMAELRIGAIFVICCHCVTLRIEEAGEVIIVVNPG